MKTLTRVFRPYCSFAGPYISTSRGLNMFSAASHTTGKWDALETLHLNLKGNQDFSATSHTTGKWDALARVLLLY